MPIPALNDAYSSLQNAPARGAQTVDLQVRVSTLEASVQLAVARTISESTAALQQTVVEARAAVTQSIEGAVAAQREAAETADRAIAALRTSIDAFTVASDNSSAELAKWSKATANWTMGLVLATVALFTAMVVQIGVMVWTELRTP